MIMQGKKSNYDTDVFQPTIGRLAALSGKSYGADARCDVAMRVVADHLRAIAFSIADGQLPSNVKAGYVIRRILRRAVRYGYTYLGFTEPFICKLVAGLVAQMGDQFPELRAQQTLIERVIEEEESSFLRTLATGITLLDGVIAEVKKQGGSKELFPLAQSEFVGYDTLTAPVRIARYRRVSAKNRTTYQLVFDRTPFYGNSGGQIGDVGFIENADEKIDVVATDKENGLIIHIVDKLPENPAADFTAVVDPAKRQAAGNNHTATHLLDAALRKVLGTHVEQKGSFVTPDYLRFDFSHFRKVTPAELREVERLVNREIRANHPLVERRDATLAEAQAEGAIMLFGEKYGDRVRMVRFGDSVELCGGTHTCATGTIGFFKIVSESAVSAGVRRIEAVTGEGAEKVLYAAEDTLQNVAEFLNNTQVVQAIKKIVESNDALSKEVEAMRQEQVREWADRLVKSLPEQNGVILMAKQSERMPAFIKDLAYNLRARVHNLVMVVGTCQEGKPSLTIMLGDDVVAKGVNAGKVIREAAREMNGGGGGQPFFATAGGKNPDKLQAAIDKAVELIMDELK